MIFVRNSRAVILPTARGEVRPPRARADRPAPGAQTGRGGRPPAIRAGVETPPLRLPAPTATCSGRACRVGVEGPAAARTAAPVTATPRGGFPEATLRSPDRSARA